MSTNMEDVKIGRCYSEWPEKVQKAARAELRRQFADVADKNNLWHNVEADAFIEQVWNAAVRASGHDGKNA